MGELSRKSDSDASHNLAPGSGTPPPPPSPAQSYPYFAPEQQTMRSHPSSNVRNEGWDYLRQYIRQTIGRNQRALMTSSQDSRLWVMRMISILKPVEASPELLRALSRFCRNSLSNRRDGPCFSLPEQLYAVHIPASHRAHIFPSLGIIL